MKRSQLRVATNRDEIASVLAAQSSSGLVIALDRSGEDLHLTYCIDPSGMMNCHVKHNGVVLWERKAAPQDVLNDILEAIRDESITWKNKDIVLQIDTSSLEEMRARYAPDEGDHTLDIGDFIKDFLIRFNKDHLVKRKLGNIGKDEVIVGFHKRYRNSLIVAFPNHIGVRLRMDSSRGILAAILPLQAILKFMDFAEELGFFDLKVSEDDVRDIKNALIECEL